jgi:hypothetical protein
MYLAQAEQHIYNQLAPPEKTLDLFEKYLPYAVALNVQNEWAANLILLLNRPWQPGIIRLIIVSLRTQGGISM